MRLHPLILALPLLALSACNDPEEESVQDKFERQEAAIVNRAERYEAEADNAVGAEEARLEAEAAALRNQAELIADKADNPAAR